MENKACGKWTMTGRLMEYTKVVSGHEISLTGLQHIKAFPQ